MKLLEKFTEGAGIALNYFIGLASIWFGGLSTLISLAIWGFSGELGVPLALFFCIFGATPIGGGIWLFRRGRIQQKLFKVKLLKESVRKLAFQHHGRLRPRELAQAQGYSEQRALDVLKDLAAEDPERVELQLDYDSGEIYFEFPDIMRALEAQKEYQALPMSTTIGKTAVEIALMLGKTVDTFQEYMQYAHESSSDRRKQQRAEQYKHKVEQFLREIEDLKQQ